MNRILLCATLGIAACMGACMGACAQQPSVYATPLLDNEGRPAANVPAAIPASPAHRTRAGLAAARHGLPCEAPSRWR